MNPKATATIAKVIFCRGLEKILVILAMTIFWAFSVTSYVSAEDIFADVTNAVFRGPSIVYRVAVIDTATNSVVTHIPVSGTGPKL